MAEAFRAGFVGVVGRPNVGKSTLVNMLVGKKIAIVSEKAQTTRNRLRGILNGDDYQIIFVDTPGVHRPHNLLGETLVKNAMDTFSEVDLILFVVDGSAGIGKGDDYIADYLRSMSAPIFLIVNKMDQVSTEMIGEMKKSVAALGRFEKVMYLSAKSEDARHELVSSILDHMPEGPRYYPEDMDADQSEEFMISEIIREKILESARDEVPHSVMVEVSLFEQRQDKDLIDISATIYVERDSQKGILIGKAGSFLKDVGRRARLDIESFLGCQVFLELRVKLLKDWRQDARYLRRFGYL